MAATGDPEPVVVVVRCLACGREVRITLDDIADALKLRCTKCDSRDKTTRAGDQNRQRARGGAL